MERKQTALINGHKPVDELPELVHSGVTTSPYELPIPMIVRITTILTRNVMLSVKIKDAISITYKLAKVGARKKTKVLLKCIFAD